MHPKTALFVLSLMVLFSATTIAVNPIFVHTFRATAQNATTVTTTYGDGGVPFSIVPQGHTSTTIYAGAATAAPPNVDPATGAIVLGTAAAYFAGAEADQTLGIDYLVQAPAGIATTITVTTTISFVHKTFDITPPPSTACAPTYIYYNDPSGPQTKTVTDCFDGTAGHVAIALVGAIISSVDEDANVIYDAIIKGRDIIQALEGLGQVQTVTFTDTIKTTGGGDMVVEVDPQVVAADSGIWLAANMLDAGVTMVVSETFAPPQSVNMPTAEANLIMPTYQVPCDYPPCSYSLSPGSNLPLGLNLQSSAGGIYGAPSLQGNYVFTVTVYDGRQPSQQTAYQYHLKVLQPLMITTNALPPAEVNTSYSFPLTFTGGEGPYLFSIDSNCSYAKTYDGFQNIGGYYPTLYKQIVISGFPTKVGACNFSFDLSDYLVAHQIVNYTLTIYPKPSITTLQLPSGDAGIFYPSASLDVTGGVCSYVWGCSYEWGNSTGADGLSFNPATGQITGQATSPGTFSFPAFVSDGLADNATANVAITIDPDVAITTTSLPPALLGQQYSTTLKASGGQGHYTWKISGSAPPGLSLSTAGVLSGAPSATGTFKFDVMVTDGLMWASKTITLSVSYPSGPAVAGKASPPIIDVSCISVCPIQTTKIAGTYYDDGIATAGQTIDFSSSMGSFNQTSCVTVANGSCGVSYSVSAPASGSVAEYTVTITAGSVSTTVQIVVENQPPPPAGTVIRNVQTSSGEVLITFTGVTSGQVSKVEWDPNPVLSGGALVFNLTSGNGVSGIVNVTVPKTLVPAGYSATVYFDRSLGINQTYAEAANSYNISFSTRYANPESVMLLFAPVSIIVTTSTTTRTTTFSTTAMTTTSSVSKSTITSTTSTTGTGSESTTNGQSSENGGIFVSPILLPVVIGVMVLIVVSAVLVVPFLHRRRSR